MASIPVAGMPNFKTVRYGKGRKLPSAKGGMVEFFGFDDLEEALGKAMLATPLALRHCLTELGLFGERETKLGTPVQYGVLRAAIGHFDPGELKGIPADAQVDMPSEADAVFKLDMDGKVLSVTWGTNIEYAPWIEWGFTMHTRRAVYFPGVGFRMVNPFSYRGAHMFERGLTKTVEASPKIIEHWAVLALTAGGLDKM